ncbi:MAG: DUF4493 domain-containing protein [Candidatus Cryptobacteroides sp.]
MKKIFYHIAIAAVILSGCNRKMFEPETIGTLQLDLSCSNNFNEITTKADSDEDIINGLTIDIVRTYDGLTKTYAPFSSIRGTVIELGSGDYIIKAYSPDHEEVAFEQPIYSGSKGFDIATGQVTVVNLVCAITNMKVSINLSANFVEELSDYTVTIGSSKGYLSWQKNSEQNDFKPVIIDGQTYYTCAKAGYFTVGKLTVQVAGHRAIDNSTASTVFYIDEVAAADHHILNLDAKVTGTLNGISITLDHSVNNYSYPVEVPGFDEEPVPGDDIVVDPDPGPGTDPEPSTAPEMIWEANPTFAPMPINEDLNADLVVKAPEGISQFKVNVDSPTLGDAIAALTSDGSTTMDLVNDQAIIEFLANLGIPTGENIVGKTSVDFFITSLVQMINMYGPEAGTQHHFTLIVTDEKDQTMNQKVTFVSE